MILTNEDKQYLIDCGYEKEDFNQIARAISKTTYMYKGEKITAEKALAIVGREAFLSGIARSAFHWTSSREDKTGERVYFDSKNLFKGQLKEPPVPFLDTVIKDAEGVKKLKEKILSVLDSQADNFIIPNQSEFYGDANNFFKAVDELIKDGVLRKRNCEGLAYEYEPSYLKNKSTKKEYSNDKEK